MHSESLHNNPLSQLENHPWAKKQFDESLASLKEDIAEGEKKKAELFQQLGKLSPFHFLKRSELERELQTVLSTLKSNQDRYKKVCDALGIKDTNSHTPPLH